MLASENGHLDVVKLLLEKGADINATDKVSFIIYIFNRPLASKVPRRNILSVSYLCESAPLIYDTNRSMGSVSSNLTRMRQSKPFDSWAMFPRLRFHLFMMD